MVQRVEFPDLKKDDWAVCHRPPAGVPDAVEFHGEERVAISFVVRVERVGEVSSGFGPVNGIEKASRKIFTRPEIRRGGMLELDLVPTNSDCIASAVLEWLRSMYEQKPTPPADFFADSNSLVGPNQRVLASLRRVPKSNAWDLVICDVPQKRVQAPTPQSAARTLVIDDHDWITGFSEISLGGQQN